MNNRITPSDNYRSRESLFAGVSSGVHLVVFLR